MKRRSPWLRDAVRTFRLVWQAHPRATAGILLVTIVEGLLPVAQAWIAKLIIDGVVDAIRHAVPVGEGFAQVLPWLIAELILVTVSTFVGQAKLLLRRMIDAKVRTRVCESILRKTLSLDVAYFEDAAFYDRLQNAIRQSDLRAPALVMAGLDAMRRLLTLLSFAALLVAFSPLITLILFGAAVPAFLAQRRFAELEHGVEAERARERRQNTYYEFLLTEKSSVNEVKVFGLGETLLARYLHFFAKWYREDTARMWRRSLLSMAFGLGTSLAYYGAYAWIVYAAVGQRVTIGEMTLYLALFSQSQTLFSALLDEGNAVYENALFMRNLYHLLDLVPQLQEVGAPRSDLKPKAATPWHGWEMEDVSFRYPSRDSDALSHISLKIPAGEKLAIVGPNGAGKSTLIKLLTGLYTPTAGRILLDGIDIRELDPDAYRAKIGIVFQDFVKYSTTLRENIGFGQISALDDLTRIQQAAAKAGADEVVASLPDGYETMLGYWNDTATSLSGGQWQRIAIARAFMRDAELLIFDEPTSALDADREFELFQRFRTLTTGRTSVLISHRFSTVRTADRIAVIANGQLVELGTHEELLATPNTYARMFHLQAEGYR
jgi:ATP-binding cassette subfamily B protein